MAGTLLDKGGASGALQIATEAQRIGYPPDWTDACLLEGIALLLHDRRAVAEPAFGRAIEVADQRLILTETPGAFDTRALALSG